MNGDSIAPYPAPLELPLLNAVSAFGTVLGFWRRYLSGAMSFVAFDKRVRGLISRLSPVREAAIASALIAAAAPAAQPLLVSWSDGNGWNTTEPPYNIFPLPVVPVVAPSSLAIQSTGAGYFTYVQSTPSAAWTIQHNLNRDPSVSLFDPDNTPILGEVTFSSLDQVVVVFPEPVEGFAYIS